MKETHIRESITPQRRKTILVRVFFVFPFVWCSFLRIFLLSWHFTQSSERLEQNSTAVEATTKTKKSREENEDEWKKWHRRKQSGVSWISFHQTSLSTLEKRQPSAWETVHQPLRFFVFCVSAFFWLTNRMLSFVSRFEHLRTGGAVETKEVCKMRNV